MKSFSNNIMNFPIFGTTVTRRIKSINQPRGGYINPNTFLIENLKEEKNLTYPENISPSLIGTAVDYMTRFMQGAPVEEAFKISIKGAHVIKQDSKATKLLKKIKGLDDNSICSAIKLTGYDTCYRAGVMTYTPIEELSPDKNSINNVRIMIERSLIFFKLYGPVIMDGFTFEGGYTNIISAGDGDFLTNDTLWDFKVSKYPPTKDNTLQLLIYWRMGLHSIYSEFQNVEYLGIYNPRLNNVYRIATSKISKDIIETAEKEIIGY